MVADLPPHHFPEGTPPQASLAGIQDKILLTRMSDGPWGWPESGAPSSHLIKAEPSGTSAVDHLIQAEDWAMRVARRAGLEAATTRRLQSFNDRQAIVVTRYDRLFDGARLHQEDFCQALALDPQAKYENLNEANARGTRLSRLVAIAAPRSRDPDGFRRNLLSLVTYNVVIGNGDAHSKNYSIFIDPRGEVSLTPLYDSAPVRYLAPRFKSKGHVINGRTTIDWITADDLAEEAATWGMGKARAQSTVAEVLEATWEAVHQVALPPGTEQVIDRLERLWAARSWRPPSAISSRGE